MYNIFTLNLKQAYKVAWLRGSNGVGSRTLCDDSLSANLFILLLGFVSGNLFPTFCGEYLGKAYIFILISLESFNYFYYSTLFEVSSAKKLRRQKLKSESRTSESSIEKMSWISKLISTKRSIVSWLRSRFQLPFSGQPEKNERNTEINDKTKVNDPPLLKNLLSQWFSFLSRKKNKPLRSLQNSLKIGFLFGLFVDAFKVGS